MVRVKLKREFALDQACFHAIDEDTSARIINNVGLGENEDADNIVKLSETGIHNHFWD